MYCYHQMFLLIHSFISVLMGFNTSTDGPMWVGVCFQEGPFYAQITRNFHKYVSKFDE